MSLTAVQYGIGPIGSRIVQVAVARGIDFVGAIDIDPKKVGADLGHVAGLDEALGVTVTDTPSEALAESPDVVFHATLSTTDAVVPQIEEVVGAGADVVSTTEELSYPWVHNPDGADAIDGAASDHGQTVLGTGINPGFAMDTLPTVLTAPCQAVDSIRVTRVQDAATRRKPLQEKVGAGMAVDRWEEKIAAEAGHVGLPESIAMMASALDWELEEVEETLEPMVAEARSESEDIIVEPGEAAGIHQIGTGYVDGDAAIELDLSMYIGAENPRDEIAIRGTPDLDVTVEGGFHGDVTTPAVVVNSAPRVQEADPGLKTMVDLATPRFSVLR